MLISAALRDFLTRFVGWNHERTLELAVRSPKLAAERQTPLVLCGGGDLVPIAWALHAGRWAPISRSYLRPSTRREADICTLTGESRVRRPGVFSGALSRIHLGAGS